jgi:hypothetical protein
MQEEANLTLSRPLWVPNAGSTPFTRTFAIKRRSARIGDDTFLPPSCVRLL